VPGFITHPELVGIGIADINVAQAGKALIFLGVRKVSGKVQFTQPDFAHVEITGIVIGVSGRCQGARGFGHVAIGLEGFGQKQMHLFHIVTDPRGKQQFFANVLADLFVVIQ